MTFTGLYNEQYTTSRELGRGGEGTVYELRNHSDLVLKKYNETLSAEKIGKLKLMVAMRNPAIDAYAAWPVDMVRDETGFFCGFVMKKLSGYVPLHMVFSPMDRKKMFPDKGYNFLVHVARNLATAFFRLHEAGLVVGDVNEGNILISSSGMVAFIDCDSFQVKGENTHHYCEVGVPRYTPPELLKKGSFEHTVRTTNTDSFSLAVLIFQLLFLGRHPFAGRNKTAADIDEETAIRQHYFAYSLDNKKNKLAPPQDSFAIANLSEELILHFHQAFEYDTRPAPAEWVKSLDVFLSDMVTCGNSRLHTYPSKMRECPWCMFRKTKGIMFFLDDSYLHASTVLGDIESFVNGFKPEQLALKKWSDNSVPQLTPRPLDEQLVSYSKLRKKLGNGFLVVGLMMFLLVSVSGFFLLPAAGCFLAAAYILKKSKWTTTLKSQEEQFRSVYVAYMNRRDAVIAEYNNPSDFTTYNRSLDSLQRLVHDFRRLPDEYDRLKRNAEEELYNIQLDEYIAQFHIDRHAIQGIGPAKKAALINQGIRTAADILKLQIIKVPGIGPGNFQILMDWRRQVASGFVYIPNNYEIARKLQKVNETIGRLKLQLESNIRREYQSVNFLKLNITNRANILETQIRDLSIKTKQAQMDMEAFRKIAV